FATGARCDQPSRRHSRTRRSNLRGLESSAHEHFPRRPLHRAPRRRLPRRALHDRVGYAARVKRRPPPALVVARELEIEALPGHAVLNQSDSLPGIKPAMEDFQDGWLRAFEAKEAKRGKHQARSTVGHGILTTIPSPVVMIENVS